MQTFLPFPSFVETASALDYRRLGKQRVETLQILRTLTGESEGWGNHPAVRMWRGYESALALYGLVICAEWVNVRGYRDTCAARIAEFARGPARLPEWIGDTDFHRSHASNLIRKDADFYGPRFPGVPSDLPYIWPA